MVDLQTTETKQASGNVGRDADEQALVRRAIQDRAAFQPLYERYWRPVYARCYAWLRDAPGAEDATSTVFLKALAKLSTFGHGSFRAWLMTITDNTLRDIARAPAAAEPLSAGDDQQSGAPGPEETSLVADDLERLSRALAELPEEWRTVVLLRAQGYRCEEIAARIPGRENPNWVAQTHRRAMQRLRTAMDGPSSMRGGSR